MHDAPSLSCCAKIGRVENGLIKFYNKSPMLPSNSNTLFLLFHQRKWQTSSAVMKKCYACGVYWIYLTVILTLPV